MIQTRDVWKGIALSCLGTAVALVMMGYVSNSASAEPILENDACTLLITVSGTDYQSGSGSGECEPQEARDGAWLSNGYARDDSGAFSGICGTGTKRVGGRIGFSSPMFALTPGGRSYSWDYGYSGLIAVVQSPNLSGDDSYPYSTLSGTGAIELDRGGAGTLTVHGSCQGWGSSDFDGVFEISFSGSGHYN
jgi:hypothetical protein